MDVTVTLNEESEWSWYYCTEAHLKAVFEHAGISATEIYANDVEDYEQMELWVKEIDPASGAIVENEYCLRFWRDEAMQDCVMMAHFLWKVEENANLTLIDQGIYQMSRQEDGTYLCLCIAEET